jgi:hypothetical protein
VTNLSARERFYSTYCASDPLDDLFVDPARACQRLGTRCGLPKGGQDEVSQVPMISETRQWLAGEPLLAGHSGRHWEGTSQQDGGHPRKREVAGSVGNPMWSKRSFSNGGAAAVPLTATKGLDTLPPLA